jgi:hypothetical protein
MLQKSSLLPAGAVRIGAGRECQPDKHRPPTHYAFAKKDKWNRSEPVSKLKPTAKPEAKPRVEDRMKPFSAGCPP